jgi:hypothetical protein
MRTNHKNSKVSIVHPKRMYLIITVDTEADNQWVNYDETSFVNIEFLPPFQTLCEKYGFPPTYLVTYRVANNPLAIEILSRWQADGRAEIGAHLHPWANPPIQDENAVEMQHVYPSELADEWLKNKLVGLTETIQANLKIRPTSYRAGRWGFDQRQADILGDLGYTADCSISPKLSWKNDLGKLDGAGGPDFTFEPVMPHMLNAKVMEVPVTILFTGWFKKENSAVGNFYLNLPNGFLKKNMNRLFFRETWLRIFSGTDLDDWQRLYRAAEVNHLPVLEFMIHSSELMPGGSPYAKTAKAVENIYRRLNELFDLLQSKGVEGITLSGFAEKYKADSGKRNDFQ